MGWGNSWLPEAVWKLVRPYIPENERPVMAKKIIEEFRGDDWDTVDEAETLATDAHWYNEEEYDAICIDNDEVSEWEVKDNLRDCGGPD